MLFKMKFPLESSEAIRAREGSFHVNELVGLHIHSVGECTGTIRTREESLSWADALIFRDVFC